MNAKILKLYLKAALHKPRVCESLSNENDAGMNMPDLSISRQFRISPQHCDAYNNISHWHPPLAALIHPCYIQTLSLAQQLEMMVHKEFPFAPMGMVHVANQICVKHLPSQSDSLRINTAFGDVFYHKRGWLFEVITTASCDNMDEPAVRATSFYLARQKHTNDKLRTSLKTPPS